MRLHRSLTLATAVALVLLVLGGSPALAHESENDGRPGAQALLAPARDGVSRGGLRLIGNLQYGNPAAPPVQNGSDIELVNISGRDYAIAGTLRNGMQIVDVTNPLAPVLTAVYDCPITQGDVQVFRQGSRVLATYTADSMLGAARTGSKCATELGLNATSIGTVLLDLTVPAQPKSLSFIPISTGSHNMTVHPNGNFLYNSNSELITNVMPRIEIIDISNPLAPVRQPDFTYPLNPSSLGANSHDVTFNLAGTRGYSASLSSTLIMNTENPARPTLITQIENPRINVEHDVKLLETRTSAGAPRNLLLVGDEIAGAAGNGACPGGGITVFDVTGALERAPVDLGTWYINDMSTALGGANGDAAVAGPVTCTAHVFKLYPEQGLLTIGWYQRGVRVLDISGLANVQPAVVPPQAFGNGIGIVEIGSFYAPDSDTWSFKTSRINTDGSFFAYGNDLARGLDVYRFDGFADERRVPALVPEDLANPAAPAAVIPEAPTTLLLALAAASILGAAALVGRRRAAASQLP